MKILGPVSEKRTTSLFELQKKIDRLERPGLVKAQPGDVLMLGVTEIDAHLPCGGLTPASLHAISGAKNVTPAIGFAAGLLGRAVRYGPKPAVLWCRRGRDLYAPGLAAFGLDQNNLIVVDSNEDRDLLWVMEEGLRSGAVAAVLGEPKRPSATALRRLQLAAETGGTTALLLSTDGNGISMGTSMTHWRVSSAASGVADGVAWPGPARWHLELLRCRGAAAGAWLVEWQTEYRDDQANDNFGSSNNAIGASGRLRLVDAICHGSDTADVGAFGSARRRVAV